MHAEAPCGRVWTPRWHYTSVRYHPEKQLNYVLQKSTWDSARLRNLRCLSDTLEITYLQDPDQGEYLNWKIHEWSSNLPHAYKDTRFLDGHEIWDYTIGSGNFDVSRAGKVYFTYIGTRPNAGVFYGEGKVLVSRGHRRGLGCGSVVPYEYCVFGDEGGFKRIFDWYPVPAVRSAGRRD